MGLKRELLVVGAKYNWISQPERLIYVGKHQDHRFCRGWFQFAKIDEPDEIWCEVREEDLARMEETVDGTS